MTGILLVHGAWHGPWCWDGFAERLSSHGSWPGSCSSPPTPPQQLVDGTFARLQDESYLAFLDTLVVLARPRRVWVPVLVLGSEHDGFFTAAELRRTAAAYRTEAETVPGIGHDLMLDLGWQRVADRIAGRVRECLSPAGML